MNNIHILILAAGSSSRIKEIKQLLKFRDKSLLQHALDTAKTSNAEKIFCVLGANFETITEQTDTNGAVILNNKNWLDGMGSSLAYGVNKILEQENDCDGILVMLADQPLITTDYLNSILEAFSKNEKQIIVSNYGQKNGVPALFSKDFFPQLIDLKGDQGAKHIIRANQEIVISLPAQEMLFDIDTREDYLKLLNKEDNK
ncbi:nucleotidyltransferase family protein [Gramella jeungdoensis]|uniref:Nucleotidyltransferase family protein n=1 Tax=Gramella jeungdoensis TaxID=708091 RepID=A0ABT0Z0M6_9FLAO|nr:nucleotidyltransferase family protein [Gramella jeungdoensis]MCM8569267.1 nucleotidyltransferase family protein [Gramella jeungdoensis]